MSQPFVKRRDPAPPGSIPDRLGMFTREVRFYREIAPTVGVRVPACLRAEEDRGSTLLELEDLSSWRMGADPLDGARTLARLHSRWQGVAAETWPWLVQHDVSDLVDRLLADRWADLRPRPDLTPAVRELGDRLVGHVAEAERRAAASGPPTLVHGDASERNMRTSPEGEVALLDWEDLGLGPGVCDLAWFLVSSVAPGEWDVTITAYGDAPRLSDALPAVLVQGLLSLSFEDEGTPDALAWLASLEEGARRLTARP